MYKFFVKMDGAEYGPYTATEIKNSELLPDILVREGSSQNWQRADSFNFIALANDEFVEKLTQKKSTPSPSAPTEKVSLKSGNPATGPSTGTVPSTPTRSHTNNGYAGNNFPSQNNKSNGNNSSVSTNNSDLIRCPECGRMSDSIKCFILPNKLLYLGCYIQWQTVQYACCPDCMRKHIGSKCLNTVLSANLMWPFVILPWSITQLIRCSQKGHTKSARNLVQN